MDLNVVQQGFPGESASGVAAQPASFTSLPDDLSLKIFGYLDHTERHAAVPLVCRNFSELVHNPSLLSDMDLDATQRKDGDSCVRGFCAYLSRRAAGHVQRVRLEFSQRPSGSSRDVLPAIEAALAACCAGGALKELEISTASNGNPMPLRWVFRLTSLTRLGIDSGGPLHICGSLDHLTQLQDLYLSGAPIRSWAEGTRLPPTITSLELDTANEEVTLRELSTLSRLQRLCLTHVHVPASDLACLASMPSVTCLRMEHCDALPPGLGHCTWLQRLELRNTPDSDDNRHWDEDDEQAWPGLLESSLAPLKRLTHLELNDLGYHRTWPAALAGCAQLHTLASQTMAGPLPAGAYLYSLRLITLPVAAVAWNVGAVAAAVQLEELVLVWPAEYEAQPAEEPGDVLAALQRVAARCTSLRLLRLCPHRRTVSTALLSAVLAAQRANPALHIACE